MLIKTNQIENMNMFDKLLKDIKIRYSWIIVILVTNFSVSASAQNIIAKLTESEIRAVIPILKAEVERNSTAANAMATYQDLRHQLFLDIQSGKVDPLDWLKQYASQIIVPPDAVYEPACSRAESIKYWEENEDNEITLKREALPTAIFSFVKENSSINTYLLGENITLESYQKFVFNPFNVDDPSYPKLHSILEKTRLFYVKNGYTASYGLSGGSVLRYYHSEGEDDISGTVYNFNFSLVNPSFPDVIKHCRSHLMGPCLEIKAESKLMNKFYGHTGNHNPGEESVKGSLDKVNITEDRYILIKVSLSMVRLDSENPGRIEVPTSDFIPVTDEEKEMAEIINGIKEDALARKSNIDIYKKYKQELDTIIDYLEVY